MINPSNASGIGSTLKRASRRLRMPTIGRSGEKTELKDGQSSPTKTARQTPSIVPQQRSNRAAASDIHPFQEIMGGGNGWARPEYGSYYASSVSVYSAIKLRADAISRPPARLFRRDSSGAKVPVEDTHPAQQLLNRANRWYTRGDLWRATEIYLNLWGSAFWALDRDEEGVREIWPLRPDRVSILPDRNHHIRGFVYQGQSGPVPYTPDEVIWMRYFNPLEEYAGLSPLAPARLSVDMGTDGLKFNSNFLKNSAQPDFVLLTKQNRRPGLQPVNSLRTCGARNRREQQQAARRMTPRFSGGARLGSRPQ